MNLIQALFAILVEKNIYGNTGKCKATASYLKMAKCSYMVAGFYFLTNFPQDPHDVLVIIPQVLTLCSTSSAMPEFISVMSHVLLEMICYPLAKNGFQCLQMTEELVPLA